MQQCYEKMLARIVVVEPDGFENKLDIGFLWSRIETLHKWYATPAYKKLKEDAQPHYIDVEYPAEYLEYCLQLK